MASFHNWTGDELIDTQVPQFLNEDNAATQEKLDTKFNKSLDIAEASDLNNFKDEGFYCCNSNYRAETILNCPTNYAFGLMVWGKGEIVYQEVREYNRSSKNQDYNNCWRRSYYSESGQNVWSNWQKMSYAATTLAGYGITDGMGKNVANSVGVPDFLKSNSNTSYLRLAGGDTFNKSATLQLYGGIHTTNAGQFLLNAADSTHSAVLSGSPSGILKWNNKNIVRSINNVAADENGNVAINVSGGGSNITVDAELSATSTNPVQNKAIYSALLDKVGTEEIFNGFDLRSPTASIRWRIGTQTQGSLTASNYTGTSLRATQDSDGNIINTTYAKKSDISGMVKSVNNVKPDSNGNVAITVSGGGSSVTVDTALSATSTNPVQNRVIKEALDGKLGKTEIAAAALKDGAGNIIANTYAKKTDISGFVKTVNGTAPDSAGNVTINVSGGGSSVTVDTELSGTSNNAIANKAVYNALLNKADTDIFRGFILSSPTATIAWRQGSQRIGSINASNYTGTAAMATSDGDGNTITSTYAKKSDISGVVKSVNGVQPDTNGNVSITVGGGGVSTSEPNTWTGKQTFQKMKFNFESYSAPRISGGTDNPSESLAVYNVQGNFTLDMSVLAGLLSNSDATLFTAYITANGSYTLSITNAGTLKYVGNASDLAITANGLLLNILLIKSSSGGLSSVVQASALS